MENKPDFLKLEEEKFGSMADNATWSDGCEHVWNTYVVPLQDKLKESEHLKELADDAIVSLQKEVERLKGESKWISVKDRYPKSTDADSNANVLAWDKFQKKVQKCDWRDVCEMKMRFTHWQPLPELPVEK